MTDGLRDGHREAIIAEIAANERVERAVLFGSRATGTNTVTSDVDVALFGDRLTLPDQARLAAALDEIPMAQSVDLVLYDSVQDRTLRKHIQNEGVEWFARRGAKRHGWRRTLLGVLVDVHREQITPSSWPNRLFAHHSIPAYDDGQQPVAEPGSAIKSNKFTVPPGALLVSLLNPRFPRVWAPRIRGDGPAICSTEFLVLIPRGSVDRRFLHYLCTAPGFRDSLAARVTGTSGSHQRVRPVDALEVEVRSPPLSEQRAIAHILGSLDDKIELNRRMNETLEAMARALFRSWFVDFDPVRAKMEGRDTGLPKDIADLFPGRLVESEMGEIPEGWEVASLGDVAALRKEGVDPAKEADDTPYIGLADMPRGTIALADWGAASSASSRKSAFKVGDVLFGKLRPYFHKVGIAPVEGLCSTDIVVLRARQPQWSAFVLTCVSSSEFVTHTSQAATGTRMPRTSWKAMSSYELSRPTDTVASEFQRLVSPLLDQIVGTIHESRTLGALRDILLPKLISGELRVGSALDRPNRRSAQRVRSGVS